jgi:hypothetical protein
MGIAWTHSRHFVTDLERGCMRVSIEHVKMAGFDVEYTDIKGKTSARRTSNRV